MRYDSMQDFIADFRQKRGWSLRRMTEKLGYSSPTTIVRLCQEKSSAESVHRFAEALAALGSDGPNEEERLALAALVELAEAGDENYRVSRQLIDMMHDVPLMSGRRVTIENVETGERTTLSARYLGREKLRMVVLNCEQVALYEELAEMERRKPFPLEHYFVEDGPASQTVERIRAIMPILYTPSYHVYSSDVTGDKPMGILQSDIMMCCWEEDGCPRVDLVAFHDSLFGSFINHPGDISRMLPVLDIRQCRGDFHPVRLEEVVQKNFVDYCVYCAELEKNRTVMRIKPDIGVELIPVKILADAFAQGGADENAVAAMLPPLVALFEARGRNALTKRQTQHHVLMRWGMWRFVRTGRLSDHPWLLRAFTVEERIEILRTLMDAMARNDAFNLYFAQDNEVRRADEFIYYEGVGLSIIKPYTDYQLGGGHAEVMVSQKRFLDAYRSFYENSLLRYRVTTRAQTLAIFEEMIHFLTDHLEQS